MFSPQSPHDRHTIHFLVKINNRWPHIHTVIIVTICIILSLIGLGLTYSSISVLQRDGAIPQIVPQPETQRSLRQFASQTKPVSDYPLAQWSTPALPDNLPTDAIFVHTITAPNTLPQTLPNGTVFWSKDNQNEKQQGYYIPWDKKSPPAHALADNVEVISVQDFYPGAMGKISTWTFNTLMLPFFQRVNDICQETGQPMIIMVDFDFDDAKDNVPRFITLRISTILTYDIDAKVTVQNMLPGRIVNYRDGSTIPDNLTTATESSTISTPNPSHTQ